ncbi:MAG: hypothetical protein ACREOF_18410 [Gemmatimonadales bacterium]
MAEVDEFLEGRPGDGEREGNRGGAEVVQHEVGGGAGAAPHIRADAGLCEPKRGGPVGEVLGGAPARPDGLTHRLGQQALAAIKVDHWRSSNANVTMQVPAPTVTI